VTAGHAGLAEFKRRGADEVRMHRYYHPAPKPEAEAEPGDDDGEGGVVQRAASALWPRLPVAATRFAGDVAYRWL
jgi:hypothetical protein